MSLRHKQRAAAQGESTTSNEKKPFLTIEDTNLLTRVRDHGDAAALGQYFENNRRIFRRELRSFPYDQATCDDLIQDAVLKILERMQSADWENQRGYSINQFAGYIFMTIRNGFISHARLASTRLTTQLFDSPAEAQEAADGGHFGVTSETLPNRIPTWDDPANVVVGCKFEDQVLDAMGAYIARKPRTVVKHLLGFAVAAMDNPDLSLHDHFTPLGKGPGNYKTTVIRGRKALAELGLTPEAIRDGYVPDALRYG